MQQAAPLGRVEVTRKVLGMTGMQVCACGDATDDEILHVCNTVNPAGTEQGWVSVVRSPEQAVAEAMPVPCKDYKGRYHFVVLC